jgi:hypothetical protein
MIPVGMVVGQAVELDFQLPSGPISVQAVVKNRRAFRYGIEYLPEQHERATIKRGCRALALGQNSSKRKPPGFIVARRVIVLHQQSVVFSRANGFPRLLP